MKRKQVLVITLIVLITVLTLGSFGMTQADKVSKNVSMEREGRRRTWKNI